MICLFFCTGLLAKVEVVRQKQRNGDYVLGLPKYKER